MKDGIIVVNKPKGLTSHAVVERIRKILGIKRIGHAGTLDPLASGVLVILVGKSTKFFRKFLAYEKTYLATLTLGKSTDTGDILGRPIKEMPVPPIDKAMIENVFKEFTGYIEQVPPMFSALKYKGKRLYELARLGIEVPRQSRRVFIGKLQLIDFKDNNIKFYVSCSTGTYIRKLASDIAERLNCVGCISEITRLKVGPFTIEEAVELDKVDESCILSIQNFI
jgi:tRNA pseudouridine55 synthase